MPPSTSSPRPLAAAGATVDVFDRLADIPAFDPDREEEPIEVLVDWRRRLAAADAVVVAVPEYAGAVAGAVKNTFDWTVGGSDVYRRPMAVISAGTSGGPYARQMMVQTLTWQGAHVVAELGIAAPRTKSDADGRFTDAADDRRPRGAGDDGAVGAERRRSHRRRRLPSSPVRDRPGPHRLGVVRLWGPP